MTDAAITLPVGQQVSLPGHFDVPVVLEGARPLAKGYECRVHVPDGTLDDAVLVQEEAAALADTTPSAEDKTPLAKAEQLRLLVEGRFLHPVVAAEIATATGQKARHIRDKGFDNQYYRDLILQIIREHQPVTREDIDGLLLDKLPEVLSREQKLRKIHNLLMDLARKRKLIVNQGSRRRPAWVLSPTPVGKQ